MIKDSSKISLVWADLRAFFLLLIQSPDAAEEAIFNLIPASVRHFFLNEFPVLAILIYQLNKE